MDMQALLEAVQAISREAGERILDIYRRPTPVQVSHKADHSPLTEADLAAHHHIVSSLQALQPALPILSEESAALPWETRREWQRYWLVDPLDGTREFISGNGEFTVNIALVEAGVPVMGVVYAPVLGRLYSGVVAQGAQRRDQGGRSVSIHCSRIRPGQVSLEVVASRRHQGEAMTDWMAQVKQRFPTVHQKDMGSSLKICLVAEGSADIYPRLAPTSEWDTAAAQAVLAAAGGVLVDTRFQARRYNQQADLINPWFLAIGDPDYDWASLSLPAQPAA